jgi:exonuclease III
VHIYCIWLTSGGRHLVKIKDKTLSDTQFVAGDENRNKMIKTFLKHPQVKKDLQHADQIPVIVAGDFNCVSQLDYTSEGAQKGLNFGRVFPVTPTHEAMLKAGFTDTYRALNPLSKKTMGYTWTTVGKGYKYQPNVGFVVDTENFQPEHRGGYTRIDFIYSIGTALKPVKSQIITHYKNYTKRSFVEFPSDHAAVLTTFKLP